MKIGLVGGTFDNLTGKPSKVVDRMYMRMIREGVDVVAWNSGTIDSLERHMDSFIRECTVLIWMPLIDNAEDKFLPTIKQKFPHLLLIQSKSMLNGEYNSFQLVKRLLDSHAALGIVIAVQENKLRYSLIDPLGNKWCDNVSLDNLVECLLIRLSFVTNLTRVGTEKSRDRIDFQLENGFLEVVKYLGEQFTEHVMAANPNRFLGNASTRCCHGFPSARSEQGDIYISQRNVDKTIISSDKFVRVDPITWDTRIKYEGDAKPSVDTPIQLALYRMYENVNYIVHGHVYIKDAPFTDLSIPCGYIEEASEIMKLVPDFSASNFAINLRGHGCIILAKDYEFLAEQTFESRPIFENQDAA